MVAGFRGLEFRLLGLWLQGSQGLGFGDVGFRVYGFRGCRV